MYDSNEDELFSVVLMANVVYGLTTLYWQIQWKLDIRPSKTDRYYTCLTCLMPDCIVCKREFIRSHEERYRERQASKAA